MGSQGLSREKRNSHLIWRPSGDLLRVGEPLLDQQGFCWGEDIKRREGNLLQEYGFVRERHPTEPGCSRYRLPPGVLPGALTLWGFGLFRSLPGVGGMLLTRAGFTARLLDEAPPDAWNRREIAVRYPVTPEEGEALRTLLHDTLGFLADYETWVQARCGPAWRARCVARWWKKRLPTATMAEEWRRLAAHCRPAAGGRAAS